MSKDPAFLFFPSDWLGGTMALTRHHKGAYMDLLMAQFNLGHLSSEQIKIVLGEKDEYLWESVLKYKFIQDSEGKYYNEKLNKEILKRRNFIESRKKNLLPHTDSHMDNHMEARMENGNEYINKYRYIDRDIAKEKGVQGEKQKVPYDEIISLYNEILPILSRVIKLTDQRKSAINQRWKEYPNIETFRQVFEKVSKSNFLIGLAKDWRADFDFIMTKSKFIKILEGCYDNIEKPKPTKERENIPKAFQGWEIDKETSEKVKDNLGHDLVLYCRGEEFDEPLKVWYCPLCDKQFNYRGEQ